MKCWMMILIARIVYEIAKRTETAKAPATAAKINETMVADPAAYAVRREYVYRI